jgi:hypothetical protein
MTFADAARYFTFYLTIVVTTAVLVWGLKLIKKALSSPTDTGKPLVASILAESVLAPEPRRVEDKGSFSRTAGAIGAIGMAAVFIGIGY